VRMCSEGYSTWSVGLCVYLCVFYSTSHFTRAKDKFHKACERASETRERTVQVAWCQITSMYCTVLILGPSA